MSPKELRRRLEVLARITGNVLFDCTFPFMLGLDAEDRMHQWWRRRAFLARYAKQSLTQWDDVEGTDVRRYCEAIAELLKEEHAKPGDDGP